MKKYLFVLSFMIAVSANAQDPQLLGTFRDARGEDLTVHLIPEDASIFIEAYGNDCTPFIVVEGKDEIESFRKSLTDMKKEFVRLKENVKPTDRTMMSVTFDPLLITWKKSNTTYTGLSDGKNIQPFFDVIARPGNTFAHRAVLLGQARSYPNRRSSTSFLLAFNKEEDIQQLISLLSLDSGSSTSNDSCPPGAVDLGLKTPDGKKIYWAGCNLGASTPEEIGDYYAWGEIETKSGENDFSTSSYKWCKTEGYREVFTKYSSKVDNKSVLDSEDDVAHVKLGGNWRLPTWEEYEQLLSTQYCTWEWTAINGVNGYKVTSKMPGCEGNWIFFPAAGYRQSDSLNKSGSNGYYWTSSVSLDTFSDMAFVLTFDESAPSSYHGTWSRVCGLPVRPVCVSSSPNSTRENPLKTTTDNSKNTKESVLQNSLVGTKWFPSDARVFEYSTFTNGIANIGARTRPRTFHMKGIISPTAIEEYNILCLETTYNGGNSGGDYFIIPNERICNIWISALTGMKELFLKNDQIAKENSVTSDVKKDVSDKFVFDGFYGKLTSNSFDFDLIVDEYNDEYRKKYGYQDSSQNKVGVFYLFEDGKSSMALRLANYYTRVYHTIWTFNSVEDFDEIINALNWSNFMQAINAQAQEIKQQQDIEARKQREQALFE